MALNDAPRVRLGSLSTPCEAAPDLGDLLGIEQLWVKRDDLIGYSWGGNKVRPIEFLLGEALDRGADTVVLCGGPTSNFAALMGVACAHHGLRIHQVSYGVRPGRLPAAMAVSTRSGTVFHFTGSSDRARMEPVAQALADRLRAEGRAVYLLPRGGATPVGALGYAHAAAELTEQLAQSGITSATVVVPVGSGGTIAGLIAGWTYGLETRAEPLAVDLVGVSVSRAPEELHAAVAGIARDCATAAGVDPVPKHRCRWRLLDGRGTGFGATEAADRELIDSIELRTRFLVDTTYNAKALRWLRDSAARLAGPVVYWHTGGVLGVVDRICNLGGTPSTPITEAPTP